MPDALHPAPDPPPIRLLLVEDDETDVLMIRKALAAPLPAARVAHARSIAEATALLERDAFELVMTDHMLPDGSSLDVLAALREHEVRAPVIVMTRFGHEDVAVAVMKAGATDYVRKETDYGHLKELPIKLLEALHRHHLERRAEEGARKEAQARLLQTIRTTVATVNHEINNPLAIISGNAQLLIELGKALGLPPEVMQPIEDIEESSRRIAGILRQLANLKEIIPREYVSKNENLLDLGVS